MNIKITILVIITGLSLAIFTKGNISVVLASFGLLGFLAWPPLAYRKHLKNENDEMFKKIEQKVTLNSIRITWVFMFLGIYLIYYLAPHADGRVLVPVWALWGIVWVTFLLAMLIQSIYGIYYLKRGIQDEN